MKKYLIILLLCSGCASFEDRRAWGKYPGAHQSGQCVAYASSVALDLQKRGFKSYYLEYNWRREEKHGVHAVVLFRRDGNWYVVDNEYAVPMRVEKKMTFLEMIQQFSPSAFELNRCRIDEAGPE